MLLHFWDVSSSYTITGIQIELDVLRQLIFMNMEQIHIITMELLLTVVAVDLVFLFITGHRTMGIQMNCFRLNKWKTPEEIQ